MSRPDPQPQRSLADNSTLHSLVTRDKWAITEQRGVKEDEPRTVYNISGKRGELTAVSRLAPPDSLNPARIRSLGSNVTNTRRLTDTRL